VRQVVRSGGKDENGRRMEEDWKKTGRRHERRAVVMKITNSS